MPLACAPASTETPHRRADAWRCLPACLPYCACSRSAPHRSAWRGVADRLRHPPMRPGMGGMPGGPGLGPGGVRWARRLRLHLHLHGWAPTWAPAAQRSIHNLPRPRPLRFAVCLAQHSMRLHVLAHGCVHARRWDPIAPEGLQGWSPDDFARGDRCVGGWVTPGIYIAASCLCAALLHAACCDGPAVQRAAQPAACTELPATGWAGVLYTLVLQHACMQVILPPPLTLSACMRALRACRGRGEGLNDIGRPPPGRGTDWDSMFG